ncbi:MAG: SpoIIE family protein phosphatase [Phycisphaerae bacterium]
MAHLLVHYPNGRTTKFPIKQPEMLVGRDASCDIILDDGITSRHHAKVLHDNEGRYWIHDLKSKNGINLNNQPVTSARLSQGDRIEIGGCSLTLFIEDRNRPTIVMHDTDTIHRPGVTSAWRPDQKIELTKKRLEILYKINERLTGRLDRDNLLNELLDICIEQFRFERAGVALWKGQPHPPQWIYLRNLLADSSGEIRISRSVVDDTLHKGERILIQDTSKAEIDPTASMVSNHILSAICVPMGYLQEVRGVIYGDRVTTAGGYTREDLDFCAALGRLGAMGLSNIQLVEEMHRRQRFESELELAREIQAHLFPSEPLIQNGLTINALNDPGLQVSGDYYDYFPRDDGLVALIIADVAGKGAPAALLMANLQAAVRVLLKDETDLISTARRLNHLICDNVSDSRFITAIFGLIDPVARRFTYVNAGHNWPYVIRGREETVRIELDPKFPLGIIRDANYTTGVIDLPDHPSTLLLYTDGVPDAENERGEQFQDNRLVSTLEANLTRSPAELVPNIRRSIKQFTRNHTQTDDITLIAVELD